jgi:hypothetical protein
MNTLGKDLDILADRDLIHVVGGGGATEGQKLTGAAVAGAVGGVVRGASAGPGGMAAGALVGASVGIGAYMINSYAGAGNKSAIPRTPQPGPGPMPMIPCHTPPMPMISCHKQGK